MIVFGTFLILFIIVILLLGVLYLRKVRYWRQHNVDVISIWEFYKKSRQAPCGLVINEYYQDMYREKKAFKVIEGLLISTLIVQDLDAIKQIMITDFECFPERGFYNNPRDPLSTTILRVECDKWKPLRQTFSPTLSPSKIKYMFPTMLKVADALLQFLNKECSNGPTQVEVYDMCARYTTDVIGNVLYGIECNSLKDPNAEFRVEGNKSVFQLLHPLMEQFALKYTKLMRFINFRLSTKETEKFFTRVVKETVEYREKHKVKGLDLMDVMIDMKNEIEKNGGIPLTINQMAGQTFALFQAGYESSAGTIRFALYELAKNPVIQLKVRQEVHQIMKEHDNKLTYEGIRQMKYLKQIILETCRLYPAIPCMTRLCRKACKVKSPSGDLTIQPDTTILLPFYGVNHNPDFYPQPKEFRPERFEDEEIAQRPAYSFLTFGTGPKGCLGELLAQVQIAVALAVIISKFKVSVSAMTSKKISFDPTSAILLFVKEGLHLTVEKL